MCRNYSTKFLRRLWIAILINTIVASTLVHAAENCSNHDKDFNSFLERFKNDKQFQDTRILYPLSLSSTEPDEAGSVKTTYFHLSREQIKEQSILIIRGRTEAALLGDGEGKLCEQGPDVKKSDVLTILMSYRCLWLQVQICSKKWLLVPSGTSHLGGIDRGYFWPNVVPTAAGGAETLFGTTML